MTDAFALLSLPPRLALDEEMLQRVYLAKSREAHPDHGGSDETAASVNAAYEILKAPEKRLKHLLEVAGPEEARAWRTVPLDEGMMGLFTQIGQALDASGRFLEKKNRAQSTLARALLATEEMRHRETLEELGTLVAARRDAIEQTFAEWDARLEQGGSPQFWQQVAAIQARLAYLARWQGQVRERLLQLM